MMKKLIIFAFVTVQFLNADYLHLKDNHCIADLTPYQNHSGWCWRDISDNNSSYCSRRAKIDDFIDGYFLDSGNCILKNDLRITGLTQNQWDYLLAVLANVMGFTMLFLISFLSILVARK